MLFGRDVREINKTLNMKIVGTGIDVVAISSVRKLLRSPERYFELSCFTAAELAALSVRNRVELIAERFAAKECILKALGTGWAHGIAWTDAEVLTDASGKSTVLLGGKAAEIATSLRIAEWTLGMTHCKTHAIASSIAWKLHLVKTPIERVFPQHRPREGPS
jgi:holo-[acyl-carrier protein] synthase